MDMSKRPSSVDNKQEVGHWEADTVYGQDGYWVTLVERVSKLLLTCRVKNKTKLAVTEAINGLLKPFMSHCLSITFDNGRGSLWVMRPLKKRSIAIPILPGLIILGSAVYTKIPMVYCGGFFLKGWRLLVSPKLKSNKLNL
ncbi:MAG: hypothetical protein ACJAUL_000197 [Paraglaciecola sp.]|jgi:hypothetical protein